MDRPANPLDAIGAPRLVVEHGAVEHRLVTAARGFALLGGAVFIGLVVMSLISIIGRKLGGKPITGDVELMQMGTAIGAAAFMPYCTMLRDHLRVEFFTEKAPAALRGSLDACANLLLSALFAALAWRTGLQVVDVRDAGEVSTLLAIPVWMPMAAMVPSLALAALCALHLAWDALVDIKAGRP